MSVRDKLILSTVGLMQRRGVAAAGIADILDDSKVSRRSIYLHFAGGKPELVAEATRWSGQWIAGQIEHFCSGEPRDALAQFISHWKTLLSSTDFEAGCPVAAAATARSVAPEAATAAGEAFARWHELLTDTMRNHGVSATRANTLATTIVAAVEGAVVMALAQRSLDALDDVESELAILVDHAMSH
ncbi:TetR/AcrR family transcriptional regulator [Williamsia sp. M5A3_1d]